MLSFWVDLKFLSKPVLLPPVMFNSLFLSVKCYIILLMPLFHFIPFSRYLMLDSGGMQEVQRGTKRAVTLTSSRPPETIWRPCSSILCDNYVTQDFPIYLIFFFCIATTLTSIVPQVLKAVAVIVEGCFSHFLLHSWQDLVIKALSPVIWAFLWTFQFFKGNSISEKSF